MSDIVHRTSRIPSTILKRALEIAVKQRTIPDSPADLDREGCARLCVAACLAVAGVEALVSKRAADLFRADLVQTRSSALLDLTFESLGWGRDLSREVRLINDTTPRCHRVAKATEIFRGLA